MNSFPNIPRPNNEPTLSYAPGTAERTALSATVQSISEDQADIPCIVGGKEIRGGTTFQVVSPHDHRRVLATVHRADQTTVRKAAAAAVAAQAEWASWPLEERAAVFQRAAALLSGPRRQLLNASTMVGQSKTPFQAEIDSACEMIDFLRFNMHYAELLTRLQPNPGRWTWNRLDYRPLEGFVYAVSPFNFTAIGGNLSSAPALMGVPVVWKPSATATLSNYYLFRLFEDAGLPPGVINFVPGEPVMVSDTLLADRHFAGIHFTGSTAVFQGLWRRVGEQLGQYRCYPRLVGETGGKDFVVAHASADPDALAVGLVRGAYEYQGQKCSAASRAYIPASLWPAVRDRMVAMIDDIRVGDPKDFSVFMGAVIDKKAFTKITGYIDKAAADPKVEVVAGGSYDGEDGYFVRPTLLRVDDPMTTVMCEEIFGPVLSVYVYPDDRWTETLRLVDETSPYALTGAVFARDRRAIAEADRALWHAAGNFYINDKPTGAVVGRQPFGGGRASGTNDKAGSLLNLIRWVSPRTIKENFQPPIDYTYPHMAAE